MYEKPLEEFVRYAEQDGVIATARDLQIEISGGTPEEVDQKMLSLLPIMRESVQKGMDRSLHSISGLTGGQAPKLNDAVLAGLTAGGSLLGRAEVKALAIAEANAAMDRIVAAPTAGSCGILPGVLLTLQEEKGLTDEQLLPGLYTAAAIGLVIATHASISGAEGGCQAECGSASAMAAAAAVVLLGGTPRQAVDAVGFALMNIMGLVCDPVQGLVEVPCVYRNVSGVSNALSAADLALSGIKCPLPPDEVVDAMKAVGDMMPPALRETGEGGCAACPSARKCAKP